MIYYATEEPARQDSSFYSFFANQEEQLAINRYVFLWRGDWHRTSEVLTGIVDRICAYTDSCSSWVLAWNTGESALTPAQYRFREYNYRKHDWKLYPVGQLMIATHPRVVEQDIFLPSGHLISERKWLLVIRNEVEELIKEEGFIRASEIKTRQIYPSPTFVRAMQSTGCIVVYSEIDSLGRRVLVIHAPIRLPAAIFAGESGVAIREIEPPEHIWLQGP